MQSMWQRLNSIIQKNNHVYVLGERDHHDEFNNAQLRLQIAAKIKSLQMNKATKCLIFRNHFREFMSDFLSCVFAGVDIVMPPNDQVETIKHLRKHADVGFGDFANALVVADIPSDEADAILAGVHAIDVEVILYTSGSTAAAKAIGRGLHCLLSEAQTLQEIFAKKLSSDSVILTTVSHQHIYGLLFKFIWPLCFAYKVWNNVVPYAENLYYLCNQFSSCMLISSPAFLTRLHEAQTSAHGLLQVVSSGGVLSNSAAEQAEKLLGAPILRVFGSTETGGVAIANSQQTLWTPMRHVELKVEDEVLLIHSPYCYMQPWFKSTDRAEIMQDGRFKLLGRADDVVKIEEKRIDIAEMSALLTAHPQVAKAQVLVVEKAMQNRRRKVLAAVVVTVDDAVSIHDLKQYLGQFYHPVTIPKMWRIVDAIPENQQGKINRVALGELF